MGDRPPGENWDGPHFRPIWVGEPHYHPGNPLTKDDLSFAAIEPQGQWRFTLEGHAWLEVGDQRIPLEPGTVLAINLPFRGYLHMPHGGHWRFLAVNVMGRPALNAFRWIVEKYGMTQTLPIGEGLEDTVRPMIAGLLADPPWDEHIWSTHVYSWLQCWWSMAARNQRDLRSALLEHLHPTSEIVGFGNGTVKEYAALLGYSSSHLSRKISEIWRKPPGQALRRARLEEAARLLRETDRSVRSIGERIGYASPSAFVRAFKRDFGDTPLKYRHSKV